MDTFEYTDRALREYFTCVAINDGRILFNETYDDARILRAANLPGWSISAPYVPLHLKDKRILPPVVIEERIGPWEFSHNWYWDNQDSIDAQVRALKARIDPHIKLYRAVAKEADIAVRSVSFALDQYEVKIDRIRRTRRDTLEGHDQWEQRMADKLIAKHDELRNAAVDKYNPLLREAWNTYVASIAAIEGYVSSGETCPQYWRDV